MGKRQQALNDKNYWHKKLETVQASRNQQQQQYNELERIVAVGNHYPVSSLGSIC